MTDEPKNDPRSRFRRLLGNYARPIEKKLSIMTRLPQKGEASSPIPREENKKKPASRAKAETAPKRIERAPEEVIAGTKETKGIKLDFGPPFWTITGILSLAVNAVLIAFLLGLLLNVGTLNAAAMKKMGLDLVKGLYTNFEKMEVAHIRANIPVQTTIPVKFDLQLHQQTNVVLTESVEIRNATVTVQTGGLNIVNALTTIQLPKGTILPVELNLTVPVDTTVPVTLDVPVDINMSDTDLNVPFRDLQTVFRPYYCLLDPEALSLGNQPICK